MAYLVQRWCVWWRGTGDEHHGNRGEHDDSRHNPPQTWDRQHGWALIGEVEAFSWHYLLVLLSCSQRLADNKEHRIALEDFAVPTP